MWAIFVRHHGPIGRWVYEHCDVPGPAAVASPRRTNIRGPATKERAEHGAPFTTSNEVGQWTQRPPIAQYLYVDETPSQLPFAVQGIV